MKPSRRLAFIPLLMLALAALACDTPLTGITCLYEKDGNIIAPDDQEVWISHDAGFTWENIPPASVMEGQSASSRCGSPSEASPISDPANPMIQYRFTRAWSIERSEDGGVTWLQEIDLRGTEARVRYYQAARREGVIEPYAGPLDAIFHSQTGNLIVAMGYEGVLIRTTDGMWHWQEIGRWNRVNMLNPFALMVLLSPHMIVGLILALLVTLTLRVLAEGRNVWGVLGTIAGSYLGYYVAFWTVLGLLRLTGNWLSYLSPMLEMGILFGMPILVSWLIAKYLLKPRHKGGFMFTSVLWTFFGGVLAVLFALMYVSRSNYLIVTGIALGVYGLATWVLRLGEARLLRWRILLGIACFTAFMIPYMWWGIGGIAFEYAAWWWSLGFAVLMVAASTLIMKRITPKEEPVRTVESPSMRDVPAPIG